MSQKSVLRLQRSLRCTAITTLLHTKWKSGRKTKPSTLKCLVKDGRRTAVKGFFHSLIEQAANLFPR